MKKVNRAFSLLILTSLCPGLGLTKLSEFIKCVGTEVLSLSKVHSSTKAFPLSKVCGPVPELLAGDTYRSPVNSFRMEKYDLALPPNAKSSFNRLVGGNKAQASKTIQGTLHLRFRKWCHSEVESRGREFRKDNQGNSAWAPSSAYPISMSISRPSSSSTWSRKPSLTNKVNAGCSLLLAYCLNLAFILKFFLFAMTSYVCMSCLFIYVATFLRTRTLFSTLYFPQRKLDTQQILNPQARRASLLP